MSGQPPPLIAPPAVQRVGRQLYLDLAACLSSHVDWFGEGLPGEWLLALDALQRTVAQCRKRAQTALEAQHQDDTRQGVLL